MMAKGAIDIMVNLEGGDVRRNSTGKIGVANNGATILPRYLRASTGSCHDFCKYGRKQAFEESEARSPMQKRITVKPVKSQDSEKTPTIAQRKMKSATNLKNSPGSKFQMPEKPVFIKREVASSAKKVDVSVEDISSSGGCLDVSTRHASNLKLKPQQKSPSSLPSPRRLHIKRKSNARKGREMGALRKKSPGGSSIERSREIGISKKRGTSKIDDKEVLVEVLIPPAVPLSPKPSVKRVAIKNGGNHTSSTKPSIKRVARGNHGNHKAMSHLKNQSNARKSEPRQAIDEIVPEKTLYVIEPEAESKTVGPGQDGTHTTQMSPTSSPLPMSKSLRHSHDGIQTKLPPSFEKKNLGHTRNGIHKTQSPPSLPPPSGNKSLKHTQKRIASTHLSSSSSSLASSVPASDLTVGEENGTVSKHDETHAKKQMANANVQHKSRPRRSRKTNSEEDCTPQKLNFRKGKVVDLQSENKCPRRLQFRQGRVQGENQNCKIDTRRSFRRREVDNELNGNTKSEKVVLKHQDVKGQKHSQSLLNNVIEETASKLVKTRKSKVKALVGAFETVISLQETKPMAVTATC